MTTPANNNRAALETIRAEHTATCSRLMQQQRDLENGSAAWLALSQPIQDAQAALAATLAIIDALDAPARAAKAEAERVEHVAQLILAESNAFNALPPEAQALAAQIRLLPTITLAQPTDYETSLARWAIRSNYLEVVAVWWCAALDLTAPRVLCSTTPSEYRTFWRGRNNRAVAFAEVARKVVAGLPASTTAAMPTNPIVWAGAAIRLYDLGVAPCGLDAKGLWELGKELLCKPPKGAKIELEAAIKKGYARRIAKRPVPTVRAMIRSAKDTVFEDMRLMASRTFRSNYRLSQTKWAGENTIRVAVDQVPAVRASAGRVWSQNTKWSGTDFDVRVTIAPSATPERVFAFGVNHRALLVSYREVARGLVQVRFLKQGRALDAITVVEGWLVAGKLRVQPHSETPAVRKAAKRQMEPA